MAFLVMFKDQVKRETQVQHNQLEKMYPFKMLLEEKVTEQDIQCSVECFVSVFGKFILQMKGNAQYFQRDYEILNTLGFLESLGSKSINSGIERLAYEYVYLGSKHGNQMIYKNNKVVRDSRFSQFFAHTLDYNLWKNTVNQINMIFDENSKKNFINNVKKIYQAIQAEAMVKIQLQ